VAADLKASPEDVFLQLLASFPKGAKATQLKEALTGLDRQLVDKGWERAKRKIDASDVVKRSDAKTPTYTLLTAPGRTTPRTEQPDEAETEPPRSHESFDTPPTSGTTTPKEQSEGQSPGESHDLEAARPAEQENSTEPTDPLVGFLVRSGLVGPHEDLESLARRPLMLGQVMARVKAADLAQLLPDLDERRRILLATVLGSGKEGLLAADAARVSQVAFETALSLGRREAAGGSDNKGRLLSTLTALVERATKSHTIPHGVLVDIAETYANEARQLDQQSERRDQARTGLGKALEAVARSTDFTAPTESMEADLARLARAARQAPFSRTGGRSFLVATLFRHDAERARSDAWWEGATFDELADAGHGPLAAALQDPTIGQRVVRPLVQEAMRGTESRSRLGQILATPAPLARWVAGEALKEAILRTGTRDEVASAWADVLTDTRELARMEGRLSAATREHDASEQKQHELQQRVSELEGRLKVIGEELAAARAAQGDVRGAHERQVKADLVRVLAKVAAQVMQSSAASADAGLVRSVSHAAAREGLDPIGTVGQRSTFDPSRHDSMGAPISPDSQVTVVRPGYTWWDGADALVLLKAQVVTSGE
jgi:hypothetical protein